MDPHDLQPDYRLVLLIVFVLVVALVWFNATGSVAFPVR